jgi:hypothetical protein
MEGFRPGAPAASPWNRLLGDAMQSGLNAARSGGMVQGGSGNASGMGAGQGKPGAGNSFDLFQLFGDLGAGLGSGHNNAFGTTMRQIPRLSQWMHNGINLPLGGQANAGGEGGPRGGQLGQGAGGRGAESVKPGGQSGGFSFDYKNSLFGANGSSLSGLNAGSASAAYSAPRGANNRFGFSASATAGMDTGSGVSSGSAGRSSFGGGGAAAGLGMGSSGGAMTGSGPGAASGASSMMSGGTMHGQMQGVGPGAGHPGGQGGGGKAGAAVNLKLTF